MSFDTYFVHFVAVGLQVVIRLYPYLEALFGAIGCGPPEATPLELSPNKTVVQIVFDGTLIPFPVRTGEHKDQAVFLAEDANGLIAENKAVISVVKYLEHTHGFEVHDISHSKIIALSIERSQLLPSCLCEQHELG